MHPCPGASNATCTPPPPSRSAPGTEAGSYLRRIDSCITQLGLLGPAPSESKEEEEAPLPHGDSQPPGAAPVRAPAVRGGTVRRRQLGPGARWSRALTRSPLPRTPPRTCAKVEDRCISRDLWWEADASARVRSLSEKGIDPLSRRVPLRQLLRGQSSTLRGGCCVGWLCGRNANKVRLG